MLHHKGCGKEKEQGKGDKGYPDHGTPSVF